LKNACTDIAIPGTKLRDGCGEIPRHTGFSLKIELQEGSRGCGR